MPKPDPRWEEILRAASRLQAIEPDAVLVGGTAAAHHVGHRLSLDADHTIVDLRGRFDAVLAALEETEGWVTARVQRPVLILGSLDGVETGVRNLIRRRPLEVEVVDTPHGPLRVPTLAEITRIKAWLVLKRNATRDWLDLVALADALGPGAVDVLAGMDDWYADQLGPGSERLATQLARQLAEPVPYDLDEVDLPRYRGLQEHWHDWGTVQAAAGALAVGLLDHAERER